MTRSWRIYFGIIAVAALALATFALVSRIARDRNAGAPLNLARPIHSPPSATPERSRPGEILATPDPRVTPAGTHDALNIARQLDAHPGAADESEYFLTPDGLYPAPRTPEIPPEVRRMGEEAVAAYVDQLEATANDEYLHAFALRDEDPKGALALYRHAQQLTAVGSDVHARAKAGELEQLKALEPEAQRLLLLDSAIGREETQAAAITRYKTVLTITAEGDALHLAAQSRLDRLLKP